MKLQIVIPVLNLWQRYTLPCIESIRTAMEHRVVVIDNGSTDDTETQARRRVCDTFTYHRNGKNLGAARVWNDGARDAFSNGYDLVLTLNNDILLHPECIDRLVRRMAEADAPGMVTPLNMRGECADPRSVFARDAGAMANVAEAECPDFAAFLLSKRCYEAVGSFDEEFFPAYFEDNDYHYRMRLAGWRAICHPQAMFYHFGSRTQNESGPQPVVASPQFNANRAYYERKWGGPPGHETHRRPFGR
jgi:GT2 family glycosyltransferase